MAKVEIYDIGLDALHQLFPNESEVEGARVGDYFLVCWGGYKEMLFPAPSIVRCHDRETAVELAISNATGDFEDICNYFMGWALEYEVWRVVTSKPDTFDYDDLLDDYVFPEMHSVEFHVYLSEEECATPNDVVRKRIGKCTFSIYMDAEDFAVRNVCEGIPSVLITNTYDAFWGETVEDAVRFLRWSGDSVSLNYRSKTFCTDQCRVFEMPTKNGSIYETLSGLVQLRKAGVR